jgi:amino acid permease
VLKKIRHILILSSDLTRKYSYKDLAIFAFGKWAGILFEICILSLCYGVCTVYIIILSFFSTFF